MLRSTIKSASQRALMSAAVLCGLTAWASAATYDFSFNGGGASIANGVIDLEGSFVQNASGTVYWPSNSNGAGTFTSNYESNSSFFTSPTNYYFRFEVLLPSNATDVITLSSTAGQSAILDATNSVSASGSSMAHGAPAPIPGGGLLSFLALCTGLAFRYQRRLQRLDIRRGRDLELITQADA